MMQAFRRDGHVLIRNLVPRGDVESFRPIVEEVVAEVAARDDPQGRIDNYSKLFTQVTNIWRISDAGRRTSDSPR